MKRKQSNRNIAKENTELYNKIEKKRKELNLTFTEMALKTKVPISTLTSAFYSLKAGKNITTGTMRMIDEALGVSFFFKK
ncbi:helix-turn-helix domain-containing protein [Fusobacterium ulcerans]|uniref:HTH cro/C1-type domain-containing protein n=1 Tax=Fusobacterium ulcerans 12-1B TaxID=457404 RepID=H1PVP2_9FUSO|nr:hypothetical protein [Fusobacterium ulcerans]EHO79746.1 hypothetical protein HMPREF0402_02485 [Fusobacterium ulcerans 12-1B]